MNIAILRDALCYCTYKPVLPCCKELVVPFDTTTHVRSYSSLLTFLSSQSGQLRLWPLGWGGGGFCWCQLCPLWRSKLKRNAGAITDRGPVSSFLCYRTVVQANCRCLTVFLQLGVKTLQKAGVVVLLRTLGYEFRHHTHLGSSLLCRKTKYRVLKIKHCAR